MTAAEELEAVHRNRELYALAVAPPGWLVVRVDGRGFSSLTETHYTKPFDARFHEAMKATAAALMQDLGGCAAYAQSDEISLVLEPSWDAFGRRAEKVATVAAGIASGAFTVASGHRAAFDGRLIPEPSAHAVANYLAWRVSDARRNALNSCLYWTLRNEGKSRRRAGATLERLSGAGKLAELLERDIDFHALEPWMRVGTFLIWREAPHEGLNPITQEVEPTTRRRIVSADLAEVCKILGQSY